MKKFAATVYITAEDETQAQHIISERINYEEEYDNIGDYQIDYDWNGETK